MTSSTGLSAASRSFADLATRVDADASVRNESWPTAGAMIDHLGNIQAWATAIVRVGTPADRRKYTRPAERERVEWFQETSAALVETLESTDPARECWTLWGAEPVVSFWQRRMTNEAAKHLWDLRTAIDPEPPMPAEISLAEQANIMDEFVDVLVPAARTRGIETLPRPVLLVARDLERTWLFSPTWEVTSTPPSDLPDNLDADIMRADVGDLALFVWERTNPWNLPDRYRIEGRDIALRAFGNTRIHL